MRYFEKQAGPVKYVKEKYRDWKYMKGQSSPWEPDPRKTLISNSENFTSEWSNMDPQKRERMVSKVLNPEVVPQGTGTNKSAPINDVKSTSNPISGKATAGNAGTSLSHLKNVRLGMIGLGTGLGAAGGSFFNSEGSLTGTLVGAGAGGLGTAIATGGGTPGMPNKIVDRGVQLLKKLRKV